MSDQTTRNDDDNEYFTGLEGAADALAEKMADAMTPGFEAECSPLEAEQAGAFREDAMSEADARSSVAEADLFDPNSHVAPMTGNVVVGAFGARDMTGKREI
jgi:hypothetical protein